VKTGRFEREKDELRAFFKKVDAGFSQKNATKQEIRAVDCVNQNKNRSSIAI